MGKLRNVTKGLKRTVIVDGDNHVAKHVTKMIYK